MNEYTEQDPRYTYHLKHPTNHSVSWNGLLLKLGDKTQNHEVMVFNPQLPYLTIQSLINLMINSFNQDVSDADRMHMQNRFGDETDTIVSELNTLKWRDIPSATEYSLSRAKFYELSITRLNTFIKAEWMKKVR